MRGISRHDEIHVAHFLSSLRYEEATKSLNNVHPNPMAPEKESDLI